jgi:hypothetical protein
MANDRLELRLNRFVVLACVVASVICFGIGAVVLTSRREDAWVVAALGALAGLFILALAVRTRLILTSEGFRVRLLWGGPLVRWSSVRRFEPDPVAPAVYGIYWLPRDGLAMPSTRRDWLVAIWRTSFRHVPNFGTSPSYLLETMNAWLDRYATTSDL